MALFGKNIPDGKESGATTAPLLHHIGIIMDGNGRWAKKRHLPREAGHKAGAETLRRVVEHCIDIDLPLLTVYAFSTENWKRPASEVDNIMHLFVQYLHDGLEKNHAYNSRIRFLGDPSPFSEETRDLMTQITEKSSHYPHGLNIAINYGGRDDIVHAVNALIAEGKSAVTEEDISSRLYTYDQPDPELIIRTGGEQRLSNFLTWQSAYSELYYTDTYWPDITDRDIDDAIAWYASRNRRFGDVESSK